MTTAVKHDYDRIPYLVVYQNNSGVRDVYGGVAELVVLESYLLKPKDKPSDTVLVFMHPIGGGAYLPMINALARAGHHVIYCNSRFRGTDSALLMEKVVEDLGECIKDAKNRLGYHNVVLAGWSGGGSLSVFYQQQAQHPTVTASPSGDGPDLTKLGLIPADGIMLLAAHISRHGTLTEWLDASILDESDPTRRDPELDLYNPDNPNQPPYREEFLARYRQAQIDEFYQRRASLEETVLPALLDLTRRYGVQTWYCGPDEPEHIVALAAALAREGLPTRALRADNSVRAGIQTVTALLALRPDGTRGLYVAPRCVNTIAEYASYQYATPDAPTGQNARRDPSEQPLKQHDHALDATRYALHTALGQSRATNAWLAALRKRLGD